MKNKFRFVNIRASRRSFIPSILSAAVAFALASNQAQAQTRVWNGTVANLTNGAWGTAGNWLAADVPDTNLEIASLSKDWTGTAPTFALGADRTVNGVIYEDTGATGDVAGSIVAGNVLTLSGTTPTITTTNSLTISATLGWGAAGFTKNGAVTLILSGGNTGTGPVTLSAGIIRATNNANALGTGAATLSLTGAGTVLQLANDTGLNFARNTTLSAATIITADRLTGAATSTTHTLGTLSIGANTLSITRGSGITGAGIGGITFGTVTQTGASVFDTGADTTLTLGALQTTAQNITKQGAGTLVLGTAANVARVAGSNILTAGTMRLGSASALGTTGATLALNGGILDLATDTTVNAYNTTVGGATTINSNKAAAASAGITHTLGTLSIGAQTLNVTRGSNATSGTGAVTFGATTMTGNATFSPAANAQLTLGAVGGAFTLTKSGAGLAVLSAAGSYTGATSVTAGTLRAGNATAFGTTAGGVSITSEAVVDLNGVAIGVEAFTLNGTGISAGGALINSSATAASLSGTISLASNSSIGGNGAGLVTLSGIISGSGTLTKVGTGTVLLTGANTFANGLTIEEGALRLQTSAAAAGTGTILLGATSGSASATLQAGSSLTHTNTITVQAGSSGTKTLALIAAPITIFSGLITMNDNLTVSNTGTGSITTGLNSPTVTNSIDTDGKILTIANTSTGRYFSDGVIYGAGSVVMNSSGTGDWVPRGDHTYSGGTTLTAGLIAVDRDSIGSPGSLTSGPFGTGTLTIAGGQMRAGSGANRTIGNDVTISGDTTFFTVASEKTLTFTGPVTLTGGNRTLTANVGSTVAGTSTVFSGAIGDGASSFGLTKVGTGNLTLGGANTYEGGTTVNQGALVLSGSLQTATALSISPTTAGGATFSLASGTANPIPDVSALTLGSATGTTTLVIELGANTAASDSIITSNAATTTGTVNLDIRALTGFGSAASYDLITAASGLSGATYLLTGAPGGYVYSLAASTDSVVRLSLTAVTGNIYWRGNTSSSWSTISGVNTNWYSDAAGSTNAQASPGVANTVNFSTTNATGPTISSTLDNNFTVNNVLFGSSPTGVTAVTIAAGLTPALLPGILTVAPSSSADGLSVASNAGNITISAPVLLGTPQTWSADGTGANGSSLTVSGAITGSGASTLTIGAGTGIVSLNAAVGLNTYSGATTVASGGILQGGVTNSFSANSAMTVNGTGILRLNGVSNTVPSLAGSGIVQNNNATTAATLTVGDVNDTTFSGTLQNGAAGTLALTKSGAGILTLSGANTYTGGTTIATGTIRQGVANALPSGRALTVNGTSVFDLNGLNASVSTLGGAATGIITDDAAGAGTSTLSITAAGSSAVQIGRNPVTTTRNIALRVTNELGGFLLTNGSNTFTGGIVLTTSTGGTRMAPAVVTAGAYGTGPITIGESPTDLATIYFANATTLTNPIIVNTALGADRVGIRVDAAVTLSGQLTANLAPITFATNGTATLTATGKITGPAGLVLAPNPYDLATARALTVNLSNTAGTNDYAGDTIVNLNPLLLKNTTLTLLAADQIPNGSGKGNVIVNSNGTGIGQLSLAGFNETINGLSGNGNVVNSLADTYTLTLGDNNATGNFSGAINNTVGTLIVTKIGSGTQTFSGASNFAGALNVNGGLVAFPASPATAGPLGNSTAVTLDGGGLSYTGSTSNALNRTVAIGTGTGTFDVTSLAGTLTVPGTDVTSTAGNLVKTGPGTLSLSGTTTLNGGFAGVVVSAGRLQAGFGSTGIATINVGAAGNLSLQNSAIQNLTLGNSAGALTVASGARLGFECDGATNDSIALGATGTPAMAAGVITLDLINFGAGVANGNTYTLLTTTAGDLTNAGATTYALGNAPSGFNYTVNVSSTAVSVTVAAFSPAYWTNSQSSGSWSTLNAGPLSNFSTDLAGLTNLAALPGSSETVSLSSSTLAGPTVATALDGNFTLYGLNFIAGSGTVTTVSVDQGSSGTLTIRPSAVAGGIDVGTNAGNVTIGAPLVASNTNSASQTWNVDGTGANGSSLTLNGVTTFTANVIKTGAGVLTLGNAGNTGAGNFTLTGGTLSISAAGNLPTGVLTIGAGTTINNTGGGSIALANSAYNWNGDFTQTGQSLDQGSAAVTLGATVQATVVTNTLTVGGAIDDGASTFGITKAGAGTLVLSGTSAYGGVTSVTAGTLDLTGSLTGGGAVATSGTGILSQSSLGVIGGASTVTQASSGTSVLAGTNTYSGLTTITGGVLRITNASALGATTAGTTQSGTSALQLDGTGGAFIVGAEPLTINGGGTGDFGALRNIAGNNTYGGTVTMAAQSRINSDAGTLTLNNAIAVAGVAQNLVVGGAGNITISGAIATTTGGVSKDGAGTLTLGGTNAYTGNTVVSTGTLNITGSVTGNTTSSTLVLGGTAGNTVTNVSGNMTLFATAGANIVGSSAVYNQTAGTVTVSPGTADAQYVARIGYGNFNLTGATSIYRDTNRFDVNANNPAAVGVAYVGGGATLNQNGGEWTIIAYQGIGQLTVAPGGSFTKVGGTNFFGIILNGTGTNGTLNIAGGTVDTGSTAIRFGNGTINTSSGFVNLAGGTLSIGTIGSNNTTSGNLNNGYYNFAGGTLRTTAALASGYAAASTTGANSITVTSTIFGAIDNAGTANDFLGGLTVDTNGFNSTFSNTLNGAAGTGVTQTDLTVSGGAGYIGAPAVTFSTSGVVAGGSPASGYALMSGGSVVGIVITNPGTYTAGTVPTITLTGGGASITPATVTSGALNTANASGGLTKINPGTLTLSGANTYTGATLVSAGRLQLDGSAAAGTPLTTSGVTVGAAGTLGFTAAATSTLNLAGKPMTLSGGTLNFDIGASGINDTITVDNFSLTANSAITFNSLGGLSEGATYTLVTSANPITNSGPFTLTGQTIGRVTLTPTINATTITVAADVDESAWGVDSDGNWSLSTNWTGYLPGAAGDAALFGSAITAARAIAVDTPQTVGFIRFNNANAYTIGANGSNFLTLNNGASNALLTVTSGSHTIAENVLLASNVVALPAATTTLTMSGVVSGVSRNVALNGAGTLELSGTGSYSGTTTVSAGTLSLTGSLTGGGAITVSGTGVLSESSGGIISGASTLTHTSSGTSTLAGPNTYTGTTTVNNGVLILSGARTATMGTINVGQLASTTGTLNISNGTFTTGTVSVGSGDNALTAGIVNQTGGTLTMSGNQLLLANNGTGTASGSNSTGTYNLSNGTLNTITGLGVCIGTNTGTTGAFNLSGTGVLNMAATSTMQIARSDNSAATNSTGTFSQTGGTATVGILQMSGTAAAAVNGAGGNSTLTLTGGTFSATTFNALSGGNNSTSTITIGGTAQVTLPVFPTNAKGTSATANITFNSTTGYLRPTATSATYLPAGTFTTAKLTANGAKIDTNNFNITVGQVLADDSTLGTLTKSGLGNLTLSGVNTYTGTTTINAGTLTINEGSIAGSSDIVNNGALAYALTTNARIYANAITGTGSLTKSGTNTLTLSGTNTYTGATTVSGGTLTISGSTNTTAGNVTVGSGATGILNIANGGSLTTTGALNLGSGIIGNSITVQTGGTASVASIANPWGANYTVDGTLNSTGVWSVSTNRTTDTFNGSGTINASALTLGNATTGVNYSGSGTINLAGAVNVASNTALGAPFYTQSSGTLNAASILLGDGTTGTRTFNLNGGRVNLGSGGIAATGVGVSTKAVNLGAGTLGASADWSSSLNMALTSVSPGATINTLDSVDNTTARTITLTGILSGTTFALNKSGAGTLILTAANTFTGATTINAGTLQLGDNGTTGVIAPTSAITNNGNLTINRTNTALQGTAFGTITGTGSLTQAGTGTTTLNAANTYTGNTILNAGLINLAVAETPGTSGPLGNQLANAADTIVFGGGILQYSATNQFDYSGRFSTAANQAYKVDTNAQTVIWATGLTSSNGTLTKSNTGTLTLSGASSYSGATTITGGTVQISAANNLGDGSATNTISLGAATLRSTSGSYDLGANRDITLTGGTAFLRADTGVFTVSGDISNGANGLTLLGLGTNPLATGNVVITGVIGTGATPTGGLTIGSTSVSANVTLSGDNLFTGNVTLSGSNTQPNSILTITNSGALGVGPKTVQSSGGGEIHLQNNITIPSGINFTLSGNPSQNGVATNRAVIYNDSGNNVINGNMNITSGNGGATIESTSGSLTINGDVSTVTTGRQLNLRGNGDGVIAGVISNGSTVALPLVKDSGIGTWTLTGANTYTGATTVSVGTLALVGGSQASPITVSAGASLGFTLDSPTTSTSTFNLTNGTIKITGTPTLPSYTLISASTGITGTPVLDTPIPGYALVKYGNVLKLENPYEVWAAANSVVGLPSADDDGDLLSNLLEYAFGTNPTAVFTGSLVYTPGGDVTTPGQPAAVNFLPSGPGVDYRAVFTRRKDYLAAGLTYTIEFSAGLNVWVPSVATPTLLTSSTSTGDVDAYSVPYPLFIDIGGGAFKKPTFFRVVVTKN